MAHYFSDREKGERPRDCEMINESAWSGIYEHIKENCGDTESFWRRARAEVPDIDEHISWDPEFDSWGHIISYQSNYNFSLNENKVFSTVAILDLIEFSFCYLGYDQDRKRALSSAVNRIFARNGLAYELNGKGQIHRLTSQILLDALTQAIFATGDNSLDGLLENARQGFLDPDESRRRDALEKLWDAFERLKTLEPGDDKKAQVTALLDRVANPPRFRAALDREAKELTALGNQLHIRHTETTQEEIRNSEHVDYLFHRLFALIRLFLRTTGRGG